MTHSNGCDVTHSHGRDMTNSRHTRDVTHTFGHSGEICRIAEGMADIRHDLDSVRGAQRPKISF